MKQAIALLILCLFSNALYANPPTLREKIGQMLVVGFEGKYVDEHSEIAQSFDRDTIGGVILFDYNPKSQRFDKNIENPEQVQALTTALQKFNTKAAEKHHRRHLPLFISVDYEGGRVNRLSPNHGFPEIPSAKEIGQHPIDDALENAELMAHTLKKSGFNLNYFPVLDVDVNPDNPIIGKLGRSFSADPQAVSYYAEPYSTQFLANNIECAYKHFPGHGSSLADSHLGFVDITDTWTSNELLPFMESLSHPMHCGLVMVAHVVNRNLDITGVPASLSYPIVSGLLRHDLHFEGVVITDDMQMKAISDHYGLADALTQSINAGVDMFIFGNQLSEQPQDPSELIDIIEDKIHSGQISKERINEAYQRIVMMKENTSHY